MNLRDLKYLVAVADLRSFVQAAEQCCISQPTLSTQIKKMEQGLGVKVFERSNKKVLATELGEQIISSARRILLEVDQIEALAKNAQNPFSGNFRLGAFPTLSTYIFPKLVPLIKDELPELIKERVVLNKRQLTKIGAEFSMFEPTMTGLKKSILDAANWFKGLEQNLDKRQFKIAEHILKEINERLTYTINYETTIKLAKIAKSVGVKQFIFSSSCSSYGANENVVDEKSELSPLTAYAKSKVLAEKELLKLKDEDFNAAVIIPKSNVKNLMLKDEVIEASKNSKFKIYAIEHIEEGIYLLMNLKAGDKGIQGNFPKNSLNYLVEAKLKDYQQKKD